VATQHRTRPYVHPSQQSVAQAVSWSKASQTGQYGLGQARKAEPAYNFEEIDALAAAVRFHDGAWRRWLAAHGIEPFELTYENLCADRSV
jgi:LPS sulfotransferase NodH